METAAKGFVDEFAEYGAARGQDNPLVKGFTTGPTRMRGAVVGDYKAFALDVLKAISDRSVSFKYLPTIFRPWKI